jgi:hypothetical protein
MLVVTGEHPFEFSIRAARTYYATEWIEIDGRLQNFLTPSVRVELREGGSLVASALSNINTRTFSLRFRLPAGNHQNLELNLFDYRTGELTNRGNLVLKIIPN